jgi:GPH family glycoside/pentoside/hexuronide:cation symporter
MENSTSEKLGLTPPKFNTKQRIHWGLASFGGALISGTYGSLLSIFYVDYLGLVGPYAYLVVIMSIAYAVWNAFNDPLFGFYSDRSKSKKGRRIPFMRYTAPFLGLFFILVWFAPISPDKISVFWWMLVTTFLYDTGYTIVFLIYSALPPELTEDEQERNKLSIFASFFSLIGMILGFLIPDFFRKEQGIFPLQMAMIAVGIVGTLFILYTTFKFKERPEFTKVDEPLKIKEAIKYTFKSKSFIVLVVANFMSVFMQSLIIGSMFYLADYVTQSSTILLLVAVFVPLILGVWITPKLITKFGVVRADQILLTIGATGLLLITFLPVTLIYLSFVLAGIGLVGPLVLTNVMFAQVIDEDELKTGVRREAVYFGMNALITKPAQSVALVLPAIMLTIANFVPRDALGVIQLQTHPTDVDFAIRAFMGLIPAIALFLEVLILQLYPLKGEYLAKVQKEILALHNEKHDKLMELEKQQKPDRNQQ